MPLRVEDDAPERASRERDARGGAHDGSGAHRARRLAEHREDDAVQRAHRLGGAGGQLSGVTVERREGALVRAARDVRILDLPGTYRLDGETPDEKVVAEVPADTSPVSRSPTRSSSSPTRRRCSADSACARRCQRGLPTLLVLTMIDEVKARGGKLDVMRLSRTLGIHVVGVVGHRGVGWTSCARSSSTRRRGRACGAAARGRCAAALRMGRPGLPRHRCRRSSATCAPTGIDQGAAASRLRHRGCSARCCCSSREHLRGGARDGRDRRLFRSPGRPSHAWLPEAGSPTCGRTASSPASARCSWFLPQIVILFTFLHFLTDVGCMARAASVVDRASWLGRAAGTELRAAAVVLRVRGTGHHGGAHDRVAARAPATILVSPFMTCSARLPGVLRPDRRVRARDARSAPSWGRRDVRALPARCRDRAGIGRADQLHFCCAAPSPSSTWSCRRTGCRRSSRSPARCGAAPPRS